MGQFLAMGLMHEMVISRDEHPIVKSMRVYITG
jgi:hypothetical protein